MRKNQRGEILFFVALTVGIVSGIAALFGFGNKPVDGAKVVAEYGRIAMEATNACPNFPDDELVHRMSDGPSYDDKHWWANKLVQLGCDAPMEISWLPEFVRLQVPMGDAGITGIDPYPAATATTIQSLSR